VIYAIPNKAASHINEQTKRRGPLNGLNDGQNITLTSSCCEPASAYARYYVFG